MQDKWEIWWAEVEYEDLNESKIRPVLVIGNDVFCIDCFKITSTKPREQETSYIIENYSEVGLKRKSTIRLGKILKIKHDKFLHKAGKLTIKQIIEIKKIIDDK